MLSMWSDRVILLSRHANFLVVFKVRLRVVLCAGHANLSGDLGVRVVLGWRHLICSKFSIFL